MTTQTHTADARTAVKELSKGDVIRIPQYEGALEVTFVSDINIGVEFVDKNKASRGASKSLIINGHSGNVYLVAGSTDKGEVKTIETVVAVEEDDEGDESDEGDEETTDSGLDEEPVEIDDENVEITKLTSRRTGKVVFEIVHHFDVHGDRREKTAAVHHNEEEWVMNGHRGFYTSEQVRLDSAETAEEILDRANRTIAGLNA